MMALLTAAHHDLPEQHELLTNVPPGGVSALAALALTSLAAAGEAEGLTTEETLAGFALASHEMT